MITRIEREISYFNRNLVPFGSRDVEEAIKTVIEGGHDADWLVGMIEEFCDSTGTKLKDIDPNYIAYDSLLQEARSDIEQITNTDIMNDLSSEVYVYGNFMCTSLDYSEEAKEELSEVLKEIDKDDFTDAITWLYSEMDF